VTVGCLARPSSAQTQDDGRAQLPRLLRDSYSSIHIGALDTPLSERQLQPGFRAASITRPRPAVRALLFGHEFSRTWSVQAAYLRPVNYISYAGVTGAPATDGHHVRTTFGSVTVKGRRPVARRLFAYGEGGLGITSRTGFAVAGVPAVNDGHYASALAGGGMELDVTPSWSLTAGLTVTPGHRDITQPRAIFASGGFRYTMRPIPPATLEDVRRAGVVFPPHTVQVELSTSHGYAVNDFVSKTVPIFWGGHAEVNAGAAVHYEHNVFHTSRLFSLDVGASAGQYRTRRLGERFYTLAGYPLLRLTFMRTTIADVSFVYSLIGPAYISKTILDGLDTGHHFTFQDFMGVSGAVGPGRRLIIGVKIVHYSNGNVFTQNAGVKIPLTATVGFAF
jgi:hypothetical protein